MPVMSFPLGSLQGDGSTAAALRPWLAPARAGGSNWLLLAGALAGCCSCWPWRRTTPRDTAFTTSGTGEALRNVAGVLGARVSDLALFLFGFSAWWLVPVRCVPGSRRWP